MKCRGHKKGIRWHVYRDAGADRLGYIPARRLVCCARPGEAVRKYLSIARHIRHGKVVLVGRTGIIAKTEVS